MKKNLILPLTISSLVVIVYELLHKFTTLLPDGTTIIWHDTDETLLGLPYESTLPHIDFGWQMVIIFLSVFFTIRIYKSIATKIDKKLIEESAIIWVACLVAAVFLLPSCINQNGEGLLGFGAVFSVFIPIVYGVTECAAHIDKRYLQYCYGEGAMRTSFLTLVSIVLVLFCLTFGLNLAFLFFTIFLFSFLLYRLFCSLDKNKKSKQATIIKFNKYKPAQRAQHT